MTIKKTIIDPETEIRMPVGRPRRRGINPYSNYVASTDGKTRPRCRVPGCGAFLRVNQAAVCSPECLRKLKTHLTLLGELVELDEKTFNASRLLGDGRSHCDPTARTGTS